MKAVGSLDHPNVVEAHDASEQDGIVYLVMKLIDGTDLAGSWSSADAAGGQALRSDRPPGGIGTANICTNAAWSIATSSRPT